MFNGISRRHMTPNTAVSSKALKRVFDRNARPA